MPLAAGKKVVVLCCVCINGVRWRDIFVLGLCLGAALFSCVFAAFFVVFFCEIDVDVVVVVFCCVFRCVTFAVLASCLLLVLWFFVFGACMCDALVLRFFGVLSLLFVVVFLLD